MHNADIVRRLHMHGRCDCHQWEDVIQSAMSLPTYFPPATSVAADAGSHIGKVTLKRAETAFIEGYDDAVVKSNIHYPADAQPLRASHVSNVSQLESIAALIPASKRSDRLTAVPDSPMLSENTERIFQRAITGTESDIKALAEWANVHELEASAVRQRLRQQQHEFAALFEMVNAMSARALDLLSLQSYMLRTVSGRFVTARVMIVRRMRPEDRDFFCAASQGVKSAQFRLTHDSFLCRYAFERGTSFALADLPDPLPDVAEIATLRALGIDTAVPLLQEVDRTGAVLEGFLFIGPKLTRKPLARPDISFLDVLSKMFAICLRNENLYRRSIVDTLTGVFSRGHFDAQLSQELVRAASTKKSICLMMIDIDRFKLFNDSHGHQTGDMVLKELARVIVEQVRSVDLVARYGGEEFAIVCVEIDKTVAREVAERLRLAIRGMELSAPDGQKLNVTASFGIACFPEDAQDMTTLVQMADTALYKSKDEGRDRITMADGSAKKFKRPSSKIRHKNFMSSGSHRVPINLQMLRRKQDQTAKHAGDEERRGK